MAVRQLSPQGKTCPSSAIIRRVVLCPEATSSLPSIWCEIPFPLCKGGGQLMGSLHCVISISFSEMWRLKSQVQEGPGHPGLPAAWDRHERSTSCPDLEDNSVAVHRGCESCLQRGARGQQHPPTLQSRCPTDTRTPTHAEIFCTHFPSLCHPSSR